MQLPRPLCRSAPTLESTGHRPLAVASRRLPSAAPEVECHVKVPRTSNCQVSLDISAEVLTLATSAFSVNR